jgi:hypothetical protein
VRIHGKENIQLPQEPDQVEGVSDEFLLYSEQELVPFEARVPVDPANRMRTVHFN